MVDNQELKRKIAFYGSRNDVCRYAAQMWEFTLEMEAQSNPSLKCHEYCDAIPYVPFEPEAFGLRMTTDSLMLDLGCLGGYGLYDFAGRRAGAGHDVPRMIGIDKDLLSVAMAQDMAQCWAKGLNVAFYGANSEHLAFSPASVDLIVARLLLPYAGVGETITEIARVLKIGGLAVLQSHSFLYYRDGCFRNLGKIRQFFYYFRAIMSGFFFMMTRIQSRHRWFSEMALGRSTLIRLCKKRGMVPIWESGFKHKPLVAFRKEPMAVSS